MITSSTSSTKNLGYVVDGGGDINADGIPDFIVTNYFGNVAQASATSTIYVIYGSETGYPNDIDVINLTADQGFRISLVYFLGNDNSNLIDMTGDVDGDGITDLVIAAARADSGQGAIYVIYGGKSDGYFELMMPASLTSNDIGYTITAEGSNFGWSMTSHVDLNGDNIADICASTTTIDSSAGAVYCFFGQETRGSSISYTSMASDRGFKISGGSNIYFGAAVATAGDFNKDQIDDLIITAPGTSSNSGKVFVLYGNTAGFSDFDIDNLDPSQGFTFTGTTPDSYWALVAASAGDFNNDGTDDIMLGAYKSNYETGELIIIYGKENGPEDFDYSSMTSDQGFILSGVALGSNFGSSFANIGDVNGDELDDYIIGAKGYDSNKGILYIIYGTYGSMPFTTTLNDLKAVQIIGTWTGALLGTSVRNIGDINQDGIPDIIIGSPGAGEGAAYVLLSPNAWACDACKGPTPTAYLGCQTCNTGYEKQYNSLCYTVCPVYTNFEEDNICSIIDIPTPEDPKEDQIKAVISPGVKGGITGGATATTTMNKALNLWSPADALPFIYGQLRTSIMYMRYLNISRTQRLEELYQLYVDTDSNMIPFIPAPELLQDAFPTHDLPYMFKRYELPSSFIANFEQDIFCLLVLSTIFLIVHIIHSGVRKWLRNLPVFRCLLHKILVFFQNFLVGSLAESLGPITFYATLEFKHWNSDKEYYIFSPLACILFLFFGVIVIILNIFIIKKLQTAHKAPSDSEKDRELKLALLEKKYEGIAIFYDEFNHNSFLQQSAFLLFTLRSILESLTIGLLFNYPLVQAIILIILNFILLAYLLIKRPFKSKIDLIQQILLVLLIFICGPCLAIMSEHDSENTINNTSNTIFWALVMFQFSPLSFFVIKSGISAWESYKWLTTKGSPKIPKKIQKVKSRAPRIREYDQSAVFSLDRTIINLDQPVRDHESLWNHPQFAKLQHQKTYNRKISNNYSHASTMISPSPPLGPTQANSRLATMKSFPKLIGGERSQNPSQAGITQKKRKPEPKILKEFVDPKFKPEPDYARIFAEQRLKEAYQPQDGNKKQKIKRPARPKIPGEY